MYINNTYACTHTNESVYTHTTHIRRLESLLHGCDLAILIVLLLGLLFRGRPLSHGLSVCTATIYLDIRSRREVLGFSQKIDLQK